MISKNLQLAIDHLEIRDVYISSSHFECSEDFLSLHAPDLDGFAVQNLALVKTAEYALAPNDQPKADQDSIRFLKVYSQLGIRWVKGEDAEKDPQVAVEIVAEWVAEYLMKSELNDEAIEEFAQKNSRLHVWPYWREYVSTTCERMRLSKVTLPMYQLLHHSNKDTEESGESVQPDV